MSRHHDGESSVAISAAANACRLSRQFPLSARLFLDASADHYLTVEDAVTAASLLLEELRVR